MGPHYQHPFHRCFIESLKSYITTTTTRKCCFLRSFFYDYHYSVFCFTDSNVFCFLYLFICCCCCYLHFFCFLNSVERISLSSSYLFAVCFQCSLFLFFNTLTFFFSPNNVYDNLESVSLKKNLAKINHFYTWLFELKKRNKKFCSILFHSAFLFHHHH